MDSNAVIILLIYYVGIASCAAQGAEKGRCESGVPILYYIKNAFGGGFMRDVLVLQVHPWLFSLSALPDVVWVIVIGYLFTYYFVICKADCKKYSIVMRIVTISDALGLGSFICIGMDKAFIYSDNILVIIACGYITAIGGGILASGKPLTKIFNNRETIRYHITTLLGCYFYYVFRHALCLIGFVIMGLILANIDYRIIYNIDLYSFRMSYFQVLLWYPAISNQNNNYQKRVTVVKKFRICSAQTKIYIVQQRLRQC